MKKTRTYDYDPVDFIKTDEDWVGYLNECIKLDEGDGRLIHLALDDIARAKGLTKVAKEAGMTRQGLRKALSEDGNPGMTTFINILKVLGMQLTVAQV